MGNNGKKILGSQWLPAFISSRDYGMNYNVLLAVLKHEGRSLPHLPLFQPIGEEVIRQAISTIFFRKHELVF